MLTNNDLSFDSSNSNELNFSDEDEDTTNLINNKYNSYSDNVEDLQKSLKN